MGFLSLMSSRSAWIEAAIILGKEKEAKVLCPECHETCLRVLDVEGGSGFERCLLCDKCKAHVEMRMHHLEAAPLAGAE
jgi:hypothetical protein